MYGHMSRCTVTCHDARSHVTMHGHMNVKLCTLTFIESLHYYIQPRMAYNMLNNVIFLQVGTDSSVRTGWSVRGSNPGGGGFAAHVQTGPRPHPAFSRRGTGSLSQR
jgi:hypothetical protein